MKIAFYIHSLCVGGAETIVTDYLLALKERGVFCTVAPEELRWQTAFGVCLAAQSKTPTGAEDLLPVYLRLSQAERERQSRMNEA